MTLPLTLESPLDNTQDKLDNQENPMTNNLHLLDSLELKEKIFASPQIQDAIQKKKAFTIKASLLKNKHPELASLGDMPLFSLYFKDNSPIISSLGVYRVSDSDPSLCLAIPDDNWSIPKPELLALSHFEISQDGIIGIAKNDKFLMTVPLKGNGLNRLTQEMLGYGELELGELHPNKLPTIIHHGINFKPIVYHPMSDLLEGNSYKVLGFTDDKKSFTVEGIKTPHFIENLTPSSLLKKASQGDKFKVLAIIDAPPSGGKKEKRKTAMIEFI